MNIGARGLDRPLYLGINNGQSFADGAVVI